MILGKDRAELPMGEWFERTGTQTLVLSKIRQDKKGIILGRRFSIVNDSLSNPLVYELFKDNVSLLGPSPSVKAGEFQGMRFIPFDTVVVTAVDTWRGYIETGDLE